MLTQRGTHTVLSQQLKRNNSGVRARMRTESSSAISHARVKSFQELPGPRGLYRCPVLGTLLNFKPFTKHTAETLDQLLYQMTEMYGPVFRLQLGRDTVVVTQPTDIRAVYTHEGKYPTRPNLDLRQIYSRRTGIDSWDVATLQGKDWQSLRMPLNKRLVKVDSASHYLQSQSLVAEDFVRILSTQTLQPEDLSDLFFRFASESMGVVCFNTRLGLMEAQGHTDQETVQFLEATKVAFQMLHRSFTGKSIAHGLYKNETYRKFEHAMGVINRYTHKHIQRTRRLMDAQVREGTLKSTEPNLLLSLLSDPSLGEAQTCQIVESLYSAGTDSTAGSLQALFYNLARHPDKQGKLLQELNQVLGPETPVTQQALTEMHYLKACVKESFRILYPVSGVMRFLPVDVVLGGYLVPAGVQILLGNVVTCKKEFSNPEQFLPERWLRTADVPRPVTVRNAVLPFGYGPRNCIGRRFAEQELYLATIKTRHGECLYNHALSGGSSETVFKSSTKITHPSLPVVMEHTICVSDFSPALNAHQISIHQKGDNPPGQSHVVISRRAE